MTNYYIKENDIITQSANWKFDEKCLETEEEIVRNDLGKLMLKSDYDIYITNPEYIAEQEAKAKEAKRIEIQKQIDELDKKRIRALAEGGEKETGLTWLEYYNKQISELRSLI